MAHQLHYTSAPTGLSGHAGFQFVAASPGATAEVRAAVSPHLSYRPPPKAPTRPSTADLETFPVSFSFQREEVGLVLVQCRYLGADYSGRFGNFLGHAVVATADELDDLWPIELWDSGLWATMPDASADLAPLELSPGEGARPASVMAWLSRRGVASYDLLACLIDAALSGLDGTAGRVVLVSDDVDTIAAWIAAVSFSIPRSCVADLSFVTYTADPDRATQRLIGTTSDVWVGADGLTQVFLLDEPAGPVAGPAPSRYATAVVEAWERGDLHGIDAIDALVARVPPQDRETVMIVDAAASGASITEAEAVAATDLLFRSAADLPDSIWPAMGPVLATAMRRIADPEDLVELVQLGQDQGVPMDTAALRRAAARSARSGRGSLDAVIKAAAAHDEYRECVLDGAIDGLADADAAAIERILTRTFCAHTFDRDWAGAPRVGARVLALYGSRHPDRRVPATKALVNLVARKLLPGTEVDRQLENLWQSPEPRIADCLALLGDRRGSNDGGVRLRLIANLTARAFAGNDITDDTVVELAERVLAVPGMPAGPVTADAHAVVAMHRLDGGKLREACLALEKSYPGTKKLHQAALARVRSAFVATTPTTEAGLLAGLPANARVRADLIDALVSSRGRKADYVLVEVAVRLWKAGKPNPTLDARAMRFLRMPGEAEQQSLALARLDKSLPPHLDKLIASRRRRGWLARLRRTGKPE